MSKEFQPRTTKGHELGKTGADTKRSVRPKDPAKEGQPGTSLEMEVDQKPLALEGDPYIVELYGLGDLYQDNIDDLSKKVKIVDKWIRSRMGEWEMEPVVEAYKEIVRRLSSQLDLNEYQSGLTKLNNLYLFVKMGVKVNEDKYA